MVRVKKVKNFDRKLVSSFGAYARNEWELVRPHLTWLYANSRRIWVLEISNKPVCVVGLKHNTLLGTGAEIYFMLCKSFSSHIKELRRFMLRALRRMVKLFGNLTVKVDSEFWIGKKFVEFFHFRNQGPVCETQTTKYDLYELRASWL